MKTLDNNRNLIIFGPEEEEKAYSLVNSRILESTPSFKVVVGEWKKTFDYMGKEIFEEIGKSGNVTEIISFMEEVRRAVNIRRRPEFIVENLERYFPPYKQSTVMEIKKLLEKGYLQLYIAPGYPLWHFGLMGEEEILLQEKHPIGGQKKHAFIQQAPSSLVGFYDAVFKLWCQDCIPLPPKTIPSREIIRPRKYEDLVCQFHPGILESYRKWWQPPLEETIETAVIIDGVKRAHPDILPPIKQDLFFYYITDEIWWSKSPYNILERVLDEISGAASHNVLYDIRRTDVNPQTVKAFRDKYKISHLPALVITSEDIVEGTRVRKVKESEVIPKEILQELCRAGDEKMLKDFLTEIIESKESGELKLGEKKFWKKTKEIGSKIFKKGWEEFVAPVLAEYMKKSTTE